MSPASDTPAETGYDPGRVDLVRLVVAARRHGAGRPDEAYVLDVTAPPAADRWDERPYVSALGRVLIQVGGPERVPHMWRVDRRVERRAATSTPSAEAEVSLMLTLPPGPGGRVVLPAEAVRDALATVVEGATTGDQDTVSRTRREQALAAARRFTATTSPGVVAAQLDVADEEHRSDQGVWTFGLVAPDGVRFDVEVGVVGSRAHSARVTRHHPAEVVDSVGLE